MQLRVELNEKKLLLSGPNPLQKLCWTWPGLPEELDVPAESFDAAICRLGLLLFLEPKKALMFVDQALKPGGKIAVMVFFHAGSKCNYG
jgi:ubiquinone/menaquinone biosynthesis C-methylase UbiE